MSEVELTWREVHLCGVGAVSRTIRNLAKGNIPKWGQSRSRLNTDDEWMGTIGEVAVAKYLDRFWAGMSFGTIDASVAEVRAVDDATKRLILHPEDRDNVPWVLALVMRSRLPQVTLCGWIMGRDGKLQKYWADPAGGRPAFFVDSADLRPMEELKALLKGEAAA